MQESGMTGHNGMNHGIEMTALREGFTTGTCAAAAAKAAVMVLCGCAAPAEVEILLPDGQRAILPILSVRASQDECEATVRKYAGDDPDVTDQLCVTIHARFTNRAEVTFIAGEGIGIVTKPGLSVPPGEPAINPVPRRMIRSAISEITSRGVQVRVSIPGGRELAARTFNPRLGIVGGLSILGTTGREKPFSVPALVESLKCALAVAAASGVESPVLVPGNIGERAARNNFRLSAEQVVQISNQWGCMLDEAARYRFRHVLALGHPGKLAKLLEGDWDTHSGRSGSAVPIVARLGEEIFKIPIPASSTVEGIFRALSAQHSRVLANALSARIAACIGERMSRAQGPAVAIINMNGDILGLAGDLNPWR
jgi:cobalt-precorrin-5B (C1)-methyltransferase